LEAVRIVADKDQLTLRRDAGHALDDLDVAAIGMARQDDVPHSGRTPSVGVRIDPHLVPRA
jgi:hypothetical protein